MEKFLLDITQGQTDSVKTNAVKSLHQFIQKPDEFNQQTLLFQLLFTFIMQTQPDLAIESLYLLFKLTEAPNPQIIEQIKSIMPKYCKFLVSSEFEDQIIDLKNGIEMQELILGFLSNLTYYDDSRLLLDDNSTKFILSLINTKNKKIRKFAIFSLSTLQIFYQFNQLQFDILFNIFKEDDLEAEIVLVILQTLYHVTMNQQCEMVDIDLVFDCIDTMILDVKTIYVERSIQEMFKIMINLSLSEVYLDKIAVQGFIYRMQKLYTVFKSTKGVAASIFFVFVNISCTEKGSRAMAQNSIFLTFLFKTIETLIFIDEITEILTNFYYYDVGGNLTQEQIYIINETITWCYNKQKMNSVDKLISLIRLMCTTGSKLIHMMNELGLRNFLYQNQTAFKCNDIIDQMDKVKKNIQ